MFNNWTIPKELFDWIRANLPDGKTILELGSGDGTDELRKHYTVHSIEHDMAFIKEGNYIHAPIVRYPGGYDWYDVSKLIGLPAYDLLLIDGPTGVIGRRGFVKHRYMFNLDVPIVVDDTQREAERLIALDLSQMLGRKLTVHNHKGRGFSTL